MDNCTYNKMKLLHELSKLTGFIEKHAKEDAKASKHNSCVKAIDALHADLLKHIKTIQAELGKIKI